MATPTPSSSKIALSPTSESFVSPPMKRRRLESGGETNKGCTLLLTGLAKAGKTKLSSKLSTILKQERIQVKELDGKLLRAGLCSKLDFYDDDARSTFVHLASEAAKLFTSEGFISIISIVAPLEKDRQEARKSHENDGLRFVEVFVDRSRVECVRETDGMKNVIHPIDWDYEPPTSHEIHLRRSGNNVDDLTREFVSELVAHKLIPPHLLQPTVAFSPSGPTSSPSTTVDSFGFDLDDDNEEEDGDDPKFFKPRGGSALLKIFNDVKNDMKSRGFMGTDEEMDKHPLFLVIMNEWKVWYDAHDGEEKYYPMKISLPPRKVSTPKKSPKTPTKSIPPPHQWSTFIPIEWTGITIRFDTYPRRSEANLHYTKCENCWRLACGSKLCKQHSEKIFQIFAILRDDHEGGIQLHVVDAHTGSAKPENWTLYMYPNNKPRQTQNALLKDYLTTHENVHLTELYSQSLLMSDARRIPRIHTATLATSMIILFRNQEIIETEADIVPHSLLNKKIRMTHTDLPILQSTLSENDVAFSVGNDYEEPPTTSPMIDPARYCWTLPRVYCGTEPNNQISIGVRFGIIGNDAQSKYTHSVDFESDALPDPSE